MEKNEYTKYDSRYSRSKGMKVVDLVDFLKGLPRDYSVYLDVNIMGIRKLSRASVGSDGKEKYIILE